MLGKWPIPNRLSEMSAWAGGLDQGSPPLSPGGATQRSEPLRWVGPFRFCARCYHFCYGYSRKPALGGSPALTQAILVDDQAVGLNTIRYRMKTTTRPNPAPNPRPTSEIRWYAAVPGPSASRCVVALRRTARKISQAANPEGPQGQGFQYPSRRQRPSHVHHP